MQENKCAFRCSQVVLPFSVFRSLADEARTEGFTFLDRLDDDWQSGENRFDQEGECLLAVWHGYELIAIGGLNVDPWIDGGRVGRVRRFYVRRDWRRKGVGRLLLTALLRSAAGNFDSLRLRTNNPNAERFYQSFGFAEVDDKTASHLLQMAFDK